MTGSAMPIGFNGVDAPGKRSGLVLLRTFSCLLAACSPGALIAQEAVPEEEAFRNPPVEARPRVWWHWLNGNITKDGIAKDLEWMKRSGIGGVQTFDINFQTPDVVKQRLLYMTPEWRDAFRFATRETDRLGLELAVASSAGWSETGGPWVPPADGMKKLVWSLTDIRSGSQFNGRLSAPPATTGPWQDLPLTPEPGAEKHTPPQYYADVAVIAYPIAPTQTLPVPTMLAGNGIALDATVLTDDHYAKSVTLPKDKSGDESSVVLTYPKAQTVRALTLFSSANTDMFNGAIATFALEAQTDQDAWSAVTRFSPSLVPTTVSFPPVTASRFRLRAIPRDNLSPLDSISAPGYAGVNYAQFLRARPIQISELRLQGGSRVNQFELKAGFAVAPAYDALDDAAVVTEAGLAPGSVIDLSSKLRSDGTLDWKPPRGNWRIIRFGASLTGKTNHPAPAEATGLEVDKMDGGAVRRYMEHYVRNYRQVVGDDLIGPRGINAILTDSTEIGAFNWTSAMREKFQQLRGYDLLQWMPALAGEIVGSRAQSDRFLFDFRRTISDLHASEHYGTVARVARENGLKVYGEALEGWRVSLGDDIDMRSYTDVPMAAMWTYPSEMGPRPLLVADLRTAAASAHLRGKPFVAAESLTSSRFPWAHGPAELRRVIDTEFAHGVNRIVIHTSPHQPVDDKKPGLSLRHIGQFFTRHETWAEMAKPWIDYISRSSYLLQQGRFAADIAYFVGEDSPAGTLASEGRLGDLPKRYGWDFVNASAIVDLFKVQDGYLVTEGGARYKVLYLSGSSGKMTLPVLRRIASLAEQGASIVGTAPVASPSLADDPAEFDALVKRLWSGQPVTLVGRGKVFANKDVQAALAKLGLPAAFSATPTADATGPTNSDLDFVERELADGAIFFVRNGSAKVQTVEARFRVSGKVPEIWDAVTGTVAPVSYRMEGGSTLVPLALQPWQSGFVVFRKPATASSLSIAKTRFVPAVDLDAGWTVNFQPGRGAPPQLHLPRLMPLDQSAEQGVRYFSGVASYSHRFSLPKGFRPGRPLQLDLGKVGDLAEIWVNGKKAGTVWAEPYALDIGHLVRPGNNALEVRVANLWTNRLIGDAQPGAAKVAWTGSPMYKADAPLRPSGLIGPVTLRTLHVERNEKMLEQAP